MENKNTIKLSEVKISADVISSIVAIAIDEVEGFRVVKSFVDKVTSKIQSIKVNFNENNDTVIIEANVEAKFGIKIQEEILTVQENIISNVEIMTGLKIEEVNINVVSLYTEDKIS